MQDQSVSPGTFRTISGALINVRTPSSCLFDIGDIARSLSMMPRYLGHLNRFYSVAEHSFLVSMQCGDNPVTALWGLLHDAPEMVLGDMAAPVKQLPELSGYRILESRLMAAICLQYGLPAKQPRIVSETDIAIRVNERAYLQDIAPRADETPLPLSIAGWLPAKAESMFIRRYGELVTEVERQRQFATQG